MIKLQPGDRIAFEIEAEVLEASPMFARVRIPRNGVQGGEVFTIVLDNDVRLLPKEETS
jgi:hypothetical protein